MKNKECIDCGKRIRKKNKSVRCSDCVKKVFDELKQKGYL